MNKYKLILIVAFTILCLVGCNMETDETYEPQEEPHLYWKDIDVVIIDIHKKHWYTGAHWYSVELTVESKEYGLVETLEINGRSAWDYEEGQTVKAELYSWVMDSTGEVIRREISQVY